MSATGTADAAVLDLPAIATGDRTKTKKKQKHQRPWHVVLLDDDDHTYDYVIAMLQKLFGFSTPDAFKRAQEVDEHGRVVVFTGSREHAELKQEQIHAYGPDKLVSQCQGSMTAVLEEDPT